MRARVLVNRKKDESEQTRRTRFNAVRLDKRTMKMRTASSDTRRSKSPVRILKSDKVKTSFMEKNSDTKFETSKCLLYKSSDSVDSKCTLVKSSKSVEEINIAKKRSVCLKEIEATKSISRSDSSISRGSRKAAGKDKQQKTDTIAGKGSGRIAVGLISKTSATLHEGSREKRLKGNPDDSEVSDYECRESIVGQSLSEIDAGTRCQMETQT